MNGSQTSEVQRFCGARTRRNTACRMPAGHGTPHPGIGPCRRHGGMLPNVIRHHAQEQAAEAAKGFGIEADVDPLSSILTLVRRAHGANDEYRRRLIGRDDLDGENPDVIGYLATMKQAAAISKMALDAGVAERLVQIAEREGEQIAALFEDILARVELSDAQRTELAEAAGQVFGLLEAGDVIDGTAS